MSVTADGKALTPDENGKYALTTPGKHVLRAKCESGAEYTLTVTVREAHSGGVATCVARATCEFCGQAYGETNPENHATERPAWLQTETGHQQKYTCCGKVTVEEAAHTWVDGVCRVCAYVCRHEEKANEQAKCPLCDSYAYVKLTTPDGKVVYYMSLIGAVRDAKEGGGIVLLLRDVNLGNDCLNVEKGNFILDLGNFVLSTSTHLAVITVSDTANLTVRSGKIKNVLTGFSPAAVSPSGATAIDIEGGTLTLENVTLEGGVNKEEERSFALVQYSGALTLNKATLNGMFVLYSDDTATVSITTATFPYGFAVLFYSNEKDVARIRDIAVGSSMFFDTTGRYIDVGGDDYWVCIPSEKPPLWIFEVEEFLEINPHTHHYLSGTCATCFRVCPHHGGTATCIGKAVCAGCGEAYGEIDPTHHAALVRIREVAATAAVAGNTEYHHCTACGKYFADEACQNEITLADTVIPKLPPEIIEGEGTTTTRKKGETLTFRSSAAREDFVCVLLDGVELSPENYTVREGSIIVELTAECLKTLSKGDHTLTIRSTGGDATTDFTVKTAPSRVLTPILIVIAVLALAAAALIILRKRKA